MRRNNNYFSTKKRTKVFPIMLVITFFACLTTIATSGVYMYTRASMNKYQKSVDELTLEKYNLEKSTNAIEVQEEEYKNKINSIREELSKYQPIVIPESMK